jgi:transcriptional regulator with XRE-family HTH domain
MKDKSVCLKIRKIRKSIGLTQSQFAELVDLSEDSIGKIERCVNVPTIETLYKISKALKTPVEIFLPSSKEITSKDFPPELKNLISYLRTRPSEDVRLIHEIAIKIFERNL